MEQPRGPVQSAGNSSLVNGEQGMVNKGSLEETMEKFNDNKQSFICTEALKIFYKTQHEEIAIRALELLEKAAQPF